MNVIAIGVNRLEEKDKEEELGEPKPTIMELAKVLAMKLEIKLEEFLSGV